MKKLFKDPLIISFLGLIFFGGILFFLKTPKKNQNYQPWLSEKIDLITKIEIKEGEKETILKKENQDWLLEDSPADQEKASQFLEKLKILQRAELVSENRENHFQYGLDRKKAIELKVFENENPLLHLLIGTPGPDFEKTHIRIFDENEVYLSNIGLRSILSQSFAPPPKTENSR